MEFTFRAQPLTERTVNLIYEFANGEVRTFESEAPTAEVPLEALIEKYKPAVFWDFPDMQPTPIPTPDGFQPMNTQGLGTIEVTTL